MSSHFLNIANTPSVKAAQARHGSRAVYARHDAGSSDEDPLGPAEAAFIAARDSFYMATVSETGWPYIQHRGGPAGFLKVLDPHTLGFADFRGNRQYLTLGNSAVNPKVSLFLMDYPNRRRLKILGRLSVDEIGDDPALVDGAGRPRLSGSARTAVPDFRGCRRLELPAAHHAAFRRSRASSRAGPDPGQDRAVAG